MPEGQCKNGKRVHTDRRGLAEQGGVSSGVSSFLISLRCILLPYKRVRMRASSS